MRVCVIGGGASGMMCATMIARKGHDVSLFEKNEKCGKKIYITGKGRCNVTNSALGNEFLKNVVSGQKFVMGAITRFNSSDTMSFFESVGVPLKIERGGRVFPVSDKSSDIIKGLEKSMHWAGVNVFLNAPVSGLSVVDFDDTNAISEDFVTSKNLGFKKQIKGIVANEKFHPFDAVVVATGGLSYPLTGSTGDGYEFAKLVGHTIVEPVPSLCAVNVCDKDLVEVEGLSLKNVKLLCFENDKRFYESEIGEMLFTKNGISGPLVLSLSSYINRKSMQDLVIKIDFKPALKTDILHSRLERDIQGLKAKQVSSLLELYLPKSLVKIFAERLELKLTDKANQLTRKQRDDFVDLLKGFKIHPKDLDGFNSAVVTAGGVNLKEVMPKYMKSKLVQGLYFVGEVLDIDALTGGFNLQLAFSTAVTCAEDFKDLKKE